MCAGRYGSSGEVAATVPYAYTDGVGAPIPNGALQWSPNTEQQRVRPTNYNATTNTNAITTQCYGRLLLIAMFLFFVCSMYAVVLSEFIPKTECVRGDGNSGGSDSSVSDEHKQSALA